MNVPNHAQTSRIRFDLQRLAGIDHKNTIKDWHGNSYQGRLYSDYQTRLSIYELVHWSTTIAQFTTETPGVVRLHYFNARYISSTTRSFQGRILNAMATALGENHPSVIQVREMLSQPTHNRTALIWDTAFERLT